MKVPMCPIMQHAFSTTANAARIIFSDCQESDCAWYDEHRAKCAVLSIALYIEDAKRKSRQ